MVSILFLGAKEVGRRCLEILLNAPADLGIEVVGVVPALSRNPTLAGRDAIVALAGRHRVPVHDSFSEGSAGLDEGAVDFLVSVQHHAVLAPAQLAVARRLAVNLHMAPLPEYRGANQFTFAILNGDTEFGTTLHAMEPRVDAGPVLAQRRFPLPADWTVKQLYDHTADQSVALFAESLPALVRGELVAVPQASLRPTARRHFYRKRDVDDLKRLDPAWPPETIARYVRAFDMPGFEPAYFEIDGRRIYLRTGY